jgi:CMP-N,N'-diacetyllegionaminic acid synthase
MAFEGMTVLAVVPARAGSKGIAHKNMTAVGGHSLIARAARVIAALPWIDRALISTDEARYAEEACRHGLDAPFLRPAALASDTATGVDTWRHAWQAAEAHYAMRFDVSVYLQPTSPFRTPQQVEATLSAMLAGGHEAATTVAAVPGHFAPQKLLMRDAAGVLSFFHAEGAQHSNRQGIPTYWYRTGDCYAATRQQVVERGLIVEQDCLGVPIAGPVVNIDDAFDLDLARWLAERDGL